MEHIILIMHVVVSVLLIGFILAQQGKGAEVGASFGSGASQTLFGSQGSGNFLTRITAILVTAFFITSLSLSYLAASRAKASDLDELLKKVQPTIEKTEQKRDEDIPTIPK